MNNEGWLRELRENEEPRADEIKIALEELTAKQRDEMRVSPYDHRSTAGRKLQDFRKKRKAKNKQSKSSRKANRRH